MYLNYYWIAYVSTPYHNIKLGPVMLTFFNSLILSSPDILGVYVGKSINTIVASIINMKTRFIILRFFFFILHLHIFTSSHDPE